MNFRSFNMKISIQIKFIIAKLYNNYDIFSNKNIFSISDTTYL